MCGNWVLQAERLSCINAWTRDICSEGTRTKLFPVTELSCLWWIWQEMSLEKKAETKSWKALVGP